MHVRRWESRIARWRPDIEAEHQEDISHEWTELAQDKTEWCRHTEKHADPIKTVRLATYDTAAKIFCVFSLLFSTAHLS